MRFHSLAIAAALLAAPLVLASPADVKSDLAARFQSQLPNVAAPDLALGAAAFDEELRAQVESHASDAAPVLEAGRKLWTSKFRDGRTLASCFPNGGRRIAAGYPVYDSRLKKVVTLEMAINQCRKTHNEPLFEATDPGTMGAAVAYVRSLASGQKVAVRVPAAAQVRFEQGRRLYFTRMGQRNFACASCHVQGAGKRYTDTALSAVVGQAAHWPLVRDGKAVTAQVRMRECLELMGAAPFPAGSDELNDLEYFVSYLSSGLTVRANAWRPK